MEGMNCMYKIYIVWQEVHVHVINNLLVFKRMLLNHFVHVQEEEKFFFINMIISILLNY